MLLADRGSGDDLLTKWSRFRFTARSKRPSVCQFVAGRPPADIVDRSTELEDQLISAPG